VSEGTGNQNTLRVVVAGRFPERAFYTLLGLTAVFIVMSITARAALRIWEIDDLSAYLNVDSEANLPTWFGTALLLFSAALLAVIASTPIRSRPSRWYWLLLSFVFVLLSIDEATRLHESLGEALQRSWETSGVLRFAWILPYGLVGLLLLGAMIPFLIALPGRTRNLMLLAGFLYVFGAAGVNAVSGALVDADRPDGLLGVINTVEELFEMVGISLFLYTLLDYLRTADPIAAPLTD